MTFGIGGNVLTSLDITTDVSAELLPEIGSAILNRAVNNTLYVSPNGDNSDGLSWATAYQSLQAGLDAASTNPNITTLIAVAPHPTYYDIDRTGDPTWAANVILHGTHRTWAKVMNGHASATSIMKFTGKASVINMNLNLGTTNNGLIMTHGGARVYRSQFIGEDLTGNATALSITGASLIKYAKVQECYFAGNGSTGNMTAMLINNHALGYFDHLRMHYCLKGIQVTNTNSDDNQFNIIDIGECGIAFDLDAGNEQHITNVILHANVINFDDEVGDHIFTNIGGDFDVSLLPDNFTGVNLLAGLALNLWGGDTQILSAASRLVPFRIVGFSVEANASEKFRVRLSHDSGSSYFADLQLEGLANANKRQALPFPAGSLPIFNYNTRISGSAKSETGSNIATIWVEIQEL